MDGGFRHWQVHVNREAAFAFWNDRFVRLTGTRMRTIEPDPLSGSYGLDRGPELVGVDRYGAAIVRQHGRLLRWSEEGGWRELLNVAPAR